MAIPEIATWYEKAFPGKCHLIALNSSRLVTSACAQTETSLLSPGALKKLGVEELMSFAAYCPEKSENSFGSIMTNFRNFAKSCERVLAVNMIFGRTAFKLCGPRHGP
jgi:hypothetical protein